MSVALPTGGTVVPSEVGGALDVIFCGGIVGIGGSVRPRPGGGVGGGGRKLRGPPPSVGGAIGERKGLAPPLAAFGPGPTPTGGGVGVPGSGTEGMTGAVAIGARDGGGPSGKREGGGGRAAWVCTAGGGGRVDAGLACAGAQCDVEGGGTCVPGVTSGSAEMGGAEVLTDGAEAGAENGDEGGGGGTDRGAAEGGGSGGVLRACALGGGGADGGLRPGGGGTLRPGGGGTVRVNEGAVLPGRAMGGATDGTRGRVSDSKMSSAITTEGRDAPSPADPVRGWGARSDGARSIHSANSLDSRP